MSSNTKTKKGEKTNVKSEKVINFRPLDTKTRKDDNIWNAMELYGDSDEMEQNYESSTKKLTKNQERRIAEFKRERMKIMGIKVLSIVRQTA